MLARMIKTTTRSILNKMGLDIVRSDDLQASFPEVKSHQFHGIGLIIDDEDFRFLPRHNTTARLGRDCDILMASM